MVFNAPFSNISAISWWSALLVKEISDLPQVTDSRQCVSNNVIYQIYLSLKLTVPLNDNDVEIVRFRVMMFNAIFNNISVITWPSVLLVEETGVSGENHQPVASY
jgi:hypothetical protein